MLSLVPDNEPILHQKLEPFNFNDAPINPETLARQLTEVMLDNKAIGVSANQLGLPHRVFVMLSYPDQPIFAVFNPKIVNYSNDVCDYREGCLTYPGLGVKIRRSVEVRARFQSISGEVITKKFDGLHARMFQHEFDHMEGKTFYEAANYLHREKAVKDWKNIQRKMR